MADRRHGRLREPSADGITKSTVCTTAFVLTARDRRADCRPCDGGGAPSAIASRCCVSIRPSRSSEQPERWNGSGENLSTDRDPPPPPGCSGSGDSVPPPEGWRAAELMREARPGERMMKAAAGETLVSEHAPRRDRPCLPL